MKPLIELKNISKRFGHVLANDSISLSIGEGSVHGLVGGNGAGKSTVMKIIYGMYQPDGGEIFFRGRKVDIPHPTAAISMGIGMLQQDFLLIENMDAVENIILGAEIHRLGIIDYPGARQKIGGMAERFGLECELGRPVSELSIGARQRIELLKILYRNSSVIILDEPTGPLVPHEVDALFDILRSLRKSGVTIIFVSHKLQEVMEICDTISVLRDGRLVQTEDKKNISAGNLVEWMTGEPIPPLRKYEPETGKEPVIELEGVTIRAGKRNILDGISLTVSKGEILGVAGVEGNGQRELEEVFAGLRTVTEGRVRLCGREYGYGVPDDEYFLRAGTIPSHRHVYGMIPGFTLRENLILGRQSSREFCRFGILNDEAIENYSMRVLKDFRVQPPEGTLEAQWLSGGNQQKLVIARVLSGDPLILMAAHPTRGVSIMDAHFIWQKLLEMRGRGGAILLVTADMNELFTLSDRILVMFKGKIVAQMNPDDADQKMLGAMMTGMYEPAVQ